MVGVIADDGDFGRTDQDVVSHHRQIVRVQVHAAEPRHVRVADSRNILDKGVDCAEVETLAEIEAFKGKISCCAVRIEARIERGLDASKGRLSRHPIVEIDRYDNIDIDPREIENRRETLGSRR